MREEEGGVQLSCWRWGHLLNFSSSHAPAKTRISTQSSIQRAPWQKTMWSKDAWLQVCSGEMIIGHMLNFFSNDYINGWLSAALLLFVFFWHNAPHSAGSNGFWTPELHILLCWMLQATDINKPSSMHGKQVAFKQKIKSGGPDHLTLRPPEGLSRHNNITPQSTQVRQVRACCGLTPKYQKSVERGAFAAKSPSFCKHHAGGSRANAPSVTVHMGSDCKENGWPTSQMFVTQLYGFIFP